MNDIVDLFSPTSLRLEAENKLPKKPAHPNVAQTLKFRQISKNDKLIGNAPAGRQASADR